jgi:hypothetical protein
MGKKSTRSKNARLVEDLYATKEHGMSYTDVLKLIDEYGLDGAIDMLEARGLKPVVRATEAEPEPAVWARG